MAAPITAYRDGKLNMGTPSDPKSHLIAILQTSKTVMLGRFYLDEVIGVTLPDGTDGVVGAVIIGGANEEMHNIATRGGVGRARVNGQTARLLNDAGLNTKPLGLTIFGQLEGGAVGVFYTPSYYIQENEIRVFYRLSGSQSPFNVTSWKVDLAPPMTTSRTVYFGTDQYPFPTSVSLEGYAEVRNSEGVTVTPTNTFTLQPDSIPVVVTFSGVELATGGAWLYLTTDVALQADISYGAFWNNGAEGTPSATLNSGSTFHYLWMANFNGNISNTINVVNLTPNPPHTSVSISGNPYVYTPVVVTGYLNVVTVNPGGSGQYYRFAITSGSGGDIIHFSGVILITMQVAWFDASGSPIPMSNEIIAVRGAAANPEAGESFRDLGSSKPSNYIFFELRSVVDDGIHNITGFTGTRYRIYNR